jgi:hypothetical protein
MRRIAFVGLLLALGAAGLAPYAAAQELQANVVSWTPNDVRPGEPVSVVLQLSPFPKGSGSLLGVEDVQVVLHGEGQTRRFATTDLGSGRYSAEIVFPEAGSWAVRIGYTRGRETDEILLGKGALCVAAVCVGPQPGETTQSESTPWTTVAVVLALAVAVSALACFRLPRPRRVVRRAL